MRVHLVDGTYEIFRQFYGQRARRRYGVGGSDVSATWGVVRSVLTMISEGATHLAVATDHVIESFRNDMWPGYKDSSGIPEDLLDQFGLLEEALAAAGVAVFPMVELEADDALASLAAVCADDEAVEQVIIWTPDKDLGQCVRDGRVVQFDRRNSKIVDEAGVVEKFGVEPASIPDYLALVGDSADGFPGIRGWGKQTAATVLAVYPTLEAIPLSAADLDPGLATRLRGPAALLATLAEQFELALLFRELATVRVDRSLLGGGPAELEWRGPRDSFGEMCARLDDPDLVGFASSLLR
ncbi:MAG: 5'-3' exonuclease [Acidimicrobiales bacterium]